MVRPTRHNGFNGARLLKLRRQERWSQGELGEKLGVHRATIVRWEACLADPPEGTIARLVELFGVPRDWLFRFDDEPILNKAPVPRVEDDTLKDIPLRKLQRWTGPALQLLGKSANALALKVDLTTKRIQEILDGHRPTSLEIQLFREGLGADFNPTPKLMKKITTWPGSSQNKIEALERRVDELSAQLLALQAIVQKLAPAHAILPKAKRRAKE